jgi:AAA domain
MAPGPQPSATVECGELDVFQHEAASAAVGCRRLRLADDDRLLEDETGMVSDTVAKLLNEWSRPDRPPGDWWRLGPHATVVVDEAGMLGTHDLHRLMQLARQETGRLVLVGDPHQLQAVGRGGMFAELCSAGHTIELERIHRFVNPWEAAASLQLPTRRHPIARRLRSP